MKNLFFLCLFHSFFTSGQSELERLELKKQSSIICYSPTNATYPGGVSKLNTFILENLNLQLNSLRQHYIPKLFISFEIYEDGSVQDVKVLNTVSEYLENEMIRVFSIMPNWTPSYTGGHPTTTTYTLPINICLR